MRDNLWTLLRQNNDGRPDIRSTDGLTLIEVLIASGIATVTLLGVAELTVSAGRAAKNAGVSNDWNTQVSIVRGVLNNESSCSRSLGVGVDVNNVTTGVGTLLLPVAGAAVPLTLTRLTTSGGADLLVAGAPPTGLQVNLADGLTIDPPADAGTAVSYMGAGHHRHQTTLRLRVTRVPAGNGGGPATYTAAFPMTVLTRDVAFGGAAAGSISACFGENSAGQACADLGGTYNANAPAGTSKCSNVTFQGTTTFENVSASRLNLTGVDHSGGNVPYNCGIAFEEADYPAVGLGSISPTVQANCTGTKSAVSGGARCNPYGNGRTFPNFQYSGTSTPVGFNPPYGTEAWAGNCVNYGSDVPPLISGVHVRVYVVCCDY